MKIVEPTVVDDALVTHVQRLLPQLSSSSALPTHEYLSAILESPCSRLLLAQQGNQALGMLTLAVFSIPSGIRAWIEDVVVDERARGKGAGEALSRHAVELAKAAGAKTVELTSRPTRIAANRLYQRIGFVTRETNVYRLEIE